MLAAIDQIFDETEQKCRNVVAQLPGRRLRGRSPRSTTTACSRASRCRSTPRSRSTGGDMTIDLSGCSAERKAGDQLAHLCRRARRLQGADRRRSIRSTKARSARSKVIIPEGNIMMARFPAPMAGWSAHRADGGRHHRHGAGARRCRTACRPAHHGAARRRGGVLRHASEDQAPLRGAEHRGRRLGRPAVRGRRVRHGLGLPGRRAQRLDRGHRAEMPGAGGEPRRCGRIPAAPASIRGGLGIDMRVRNLVEGRWNFEHAAAQQVPALGPVGRHARRARRLSAAAAGRERVHA